MPALDRQGRFAGLAQLKPAQATLRGGDEVRAFLSQHGVTPLEGSSGSADGALLRVICVRK